MSEFLSAYAKGPKGQSPAFLFCDHATNALPASYGSLGLSAEQISDHIAYDPGAAALTEMLGERLRARTVYCGFSRLLIDPNRGQERDDLVMEESDCVSIASNQNLSWEEREHRINSYYRPYHEFLDHELEAHTHAVSDPLIVSIHSFCRALRCRESHRPWQVGILWKDDKKSAEAMINALRHHGLSVGDNEPYSAKAYNYTVDRHVGARGLRHLTLEIRQDLIADETHVRQWADLIETPLRALIGAGT